MSGRTAPPAPGAPRDPLAGFAPGHPAVARLVLESLRTLATAGDAGTRRWAEDVLAGRRSVRDVPPTESLRSAADAAADTAARWSALDDDERAALAERGRLRAEELLRGNAGRNAGPGADHG